MKTINLSKRDALNYVFKNAPVISIRFDKRKPIVRQILSMYTYQELKEIEQKKMNRMNKSIYNYAPIKKYRYIISLQKNAPENYRKEIVVGIDSIHLASPIYRNRDYNKSVIFANTENNRIKANLINKLINKAV